MAITKKIRDIREGAGHMSSGAPVNLITYSVPASTSILARVDYIYYSTDGTQQQGAQSFYVNAYRDNTSALVVSSPQVNCNFGPYFETSMPVEAVASSNDLIIRIVNGSPNNCDVFCWAEFLHGESNLG